MYASDYSPEMLLVTFMTSKNPTEAASLFTRPSTVGQQTLKDYRQMFTFDGQHQLTVLRIVHASGEAPWAIGFMLVKGILLSNRNGISLAEVIQRSKLLDNVTAFIKKDKTFSDTIKSILNFAAAFESDYEVKFTDTHAPDVVADLQSSDFLPIYL